MLLAALAVGGAWFYAFTARDQLAEAIQYNKKAIEAFNTGRAQTDAALSEVQKQTNAVIVSQLPIFSYGVDPVGKEAIPSAASLVIRNVGKSPAQLRTIRIASRIANEFPSNPLTDVSDRLFPTQTWVEAGGRFRSLETKIAIRPTLDEMVQIREGKTRVWVIGVWCFSVKYNPNAGEEAKRGCEHGYYRNRFARRYDVKSRSFVDDERIPDNYTER